MTETNRIEFKRQYTGDLDIEKEVIAFLNYKELMRVFRDVEMVEALGSGMLIILRKYSRESYEFMPHFIRLKIKAFKEDDTKNVVRNVPKTDSQIRREEIIKLIREDNTITASAIAKRLNVTLRTIQRELAEMRHIVQHIGATKRGHWEFL